MSDKFHPGETVLLKYGSPRMVVTGFRDDRDRVECVWQAVRKEELINVFAYAMSGSAVGCMQRYFFDPTILFSADDQYPDIYQKKVGVSSVVTIAPGCSQMQVLSIKGEVATCVFFFNDIAHIHDFYVAALKGVSEPTISDVQVNKGDKVALELNSSPLMTVVSDVDCEGLVECTWSESGKTFEYRFPTVLLHHRDPSEFEVPF